MTTEKGKSFNRNGAMQYAEEHLYQLPKKAHKDDLLLAKVIEECVLEDVKDIPEKDRFDCGDCHRVVQEPDEWCWFCGADISEVLDVQSAGEGPEEKTEPQGKPAKVENKAALVKPEKQKKPEKPTQGKSIQVQDKTSTEPENQEGKERNLARFISEILEENGRAGYSAWLIGRSLIEIQTSNSYLEKYETFEECVNKELAYSWRAASEYMRIFKNFQEQDAKLPGLGFVKLLIIAGAPENARPKLLKSATPKSAGGKGLTREEIKQAVRDECDKVGDPPRPGRDPKVKIEPWVKALMKEPLEVTIKDGGGSKDAGGGHEVKVTVLKTKVRVWVEKVEG